MKKLSPLKAIRAFCVYCMGGSSQLPKECPSKDTCPLWPYRNGHNPNRAGIGDGDGAGVSEAMKKARAESAARFRALALASKGKGVSDRVKPVKKVRVQEGKSAIREGSGASGKQIAKVDRKPKAKKAGKGE